MNSQNLLKLLKVGKILLFSILWYSVSAQNVTVNPGATSYATLKDAFDAINAGTHTGALTIDIVANTTETAPAVLTSSGIGTASYTSILIRPINDGVSISGATVTGRGVIELNGADNVIIDGDNPNTGGTNRNLTVTNTAINTITFTSVIRVATGTGNLSADNITLTNLILNGSAVGRNISTATSTAGSENTTFGVIVGPNGSATVPTAIAGVTTAMATGATANAFVLNNCTINQVGRGVSVLGSSNASITSVTITNNVIGSAGASSPSTPPFTSPNNTVYAKGVIVQGFSSLTVTGNTIQNIISYVGATINGIELTSTAGAASGTINVSNNTISNVAANALGAANGIIFTVSTAPFTVANNTISNIQNTSSASIAGISIASTVAAPSGILTANRVSTVYANNTGGYASRGIIINSGNAITLSNNMIWDINAVANNPNTGTTFAVRGIQIVAGTGHNILNNTVSLYGPILAGGSGVDVTTALGISSTSATGLTIKNNIFSNTMSGGAATMIHTCLQLPTGATSAMNLTLNNNAYYQGTGSTNYILSTTLPTTYLAANFNANATTPATNSRSYTSTLSAAGSNDNASFATTAPAPFVSATNLHINTGTTPTLLESGGMVVGVNTDIDADTRPGPAGSVNGGGILPDIGADEFDGVILDISGPGIIFTPMPALCVTSNTTVLSPVTITDLSGVPITGSLVPRIYYNKNGGTYASQPGILLSGTGLNGQWSFTLDFSLVGGIAFGDIINYYIIAQDIVVPVNITSNPQGAVATDVNTVTTHPSTPLSFVVQQPLNGTYTIGSGGNFTTLTSAVAAYNTGCVTGPVVFSLINPTYSTATGEIFPIVINSIPAASATNTLTIKPTVATTITGSAPSIIQILGGDYVTIDGSISAVANSICPLVKATRDLTVVNTTTTSPNAVIAISTLGSVLTSANPATNVTVKNVNVIGGTNATITSYGIFNGGAVGFTGFDNDNILVENNSIQTTTVGIGFFGTSLATAFDNNHIRLNDIGTTVSTSSVGQFGIQARAIINSFISKNSIVGIGLGTGILTNPKGIDIQANVTNSTINLNNITGIKYYGTSGYGGKGIDINTTVSASNLTVANNTLSDITGDGWSSQIGDAIVGIRVLSTSALVTGGINIWNNTVNLFGPISRASATADKSSCLHIQNTAVGLDVRNNIFVNSIENTTGVAIAFAISTDATVSPFSTINNNAYCASGAEGILGLYGTTNMTTLAAWQAATTQDALSLALCPVFVSNTDLHLTSSATNAPLLCSGANLPLVSSDIDCETRKITPTIGADESGLVTASITVTEASGITSNDGILCSGDMATLTASAGVNYIWSNGATTNTITANTTGTYTVTVTDVSGCAASSMTSIVVNALPTPSIAFAETSGTANNDGVICQGTSATLNASGGISYLWNIGSTSASISTSTQGTYTVTVTDSNGCSSATSQTLTVTDPPTVSSSLTQPTTCVSTDGAINITVTASGTNTYLWSNGATTEDISGLGVGNYTVTVTNSSTACSGITTISLAGPGGCGSCPTIGSLASTSPICLGTSSTLTASGLTDMGNTYGIQFVSFASATANPYTGGTLLATVPNGSLTSTGTVATASYTFSSIGTYFVYAILNPLPTDPTCRPSLLKTIVVNALPVAAIAIADNSGTTNNDGIICQGATATLTAGGGTSYIWSTGATTTAISTGTAGTYTVTVTNANACTASTSSTIVVNPLPTATIAKTDNSGTTNNDGIICQGATATLTAGGGTSYIWSTGATTTAISTGTAGTYTVTVTNANACTASTSSTIVVNLLPTATIAKTDNSGTTNNDGIICQGATATLTAGGGTSYIWSTGATTTAISTGTAGTYTVTVTNANACTASTSSTIVVNTNPIPTLTYTDASGLTSNDGIICQGAMATMTAGGGTGYVWSTGATTATVSTGTAGTYTVTVSNANGCTAITTGTIVVNPLPVPLINVSETSGTANDGTIYRGDAATLTATGGGTYLWNTGATTSSISVSPMVTTTYTVTVTNANGCTASATRTITVIEPPCFLVCSGDQNVTLAGGECNYTVPNLVTMAGPCLDGSVVPPPVVGFTGAFAYANRYFHNTALGSDPAYGNLPCTTTTGLPGTLVLQSADVLSGGNTCNYYGTVVSWTVPANGTISFNWATSTNDPGWDDFGYSTTLNPNTATGLFFANLQANTTVLADVTSSGMRSVPVTQGQIFSFINYTEDGTGGSLTATITNFRFQAAVVPAPWVINHVSGPEAGDVLAPGTYTLCYELLNPAGDATDDCCFDIVVEGYPTPTRSLVCNSRVNISADENCEVSVNADMFLEGGPYACYESYQINIWPFNSKANAIKDIAQNTGIYLPCGEHTYEIIDPVTGNICWGTFIVEDKIAPVVTCNCQDIDIPTPVTSFAGSLDATDPLFDRCGFTGYGTWPYDVYQFTVTVSGSYTFTASSPAGDTYAYINSGSFDPANPCVGMIAQNDDSAGGLDPLITVNLTAGTTYYYIFTNWSPFDAPSGAYTVTITGPGQAITIVNPSDSPACQFSCYELDVVKGETVGMLYDIPGQNANKSKLTTPPAVVDACGGVSMTFEDRITKTNCGDTKLIRDWKFTDAKGNVSLCSQTFTFGQITVFDLVPPVREVHLSCGLDASPAAIAGYLDVDSRPQPASTTNIGAFADDYAQTPYVVEWNEGYQYGYFTYTLPGYTPANTFHSQKVDNSVCNIYTTYTDDVIPACGIGCSGNMKVIRNWKLLDWCTGEVFTYTQVIKATDEKAPSFNVKNATISVDPWGCKANWTVEKPWELEDNCAKSEEIKWGVKVPAGLTLSGTQPNYSVTGMPKGTHAIVYWAEDCCGNITEKTAYVTVIDGSAPVAVAKQNIVMSLTGSGNGADGAGKIYGWQIDNGSYDHCSDVRFEVRRVDGGSCGNVGANGTHNNNSTYNNHNGYPSEVPGAVWFHPMDNAQDTDGGEFVKFCCEDIPAGADHGLHDVELRVWDDGNMNGIYGDNDIIYNGVTEMKDNYNTTWVTIRVENKLPPTLICPKDVTVTCDMELNLSEGVDTKVSDVNLTMTGYPKAYDLCSNLDITYSDQWVGQHDPVCKSGTIRRTFKVTKGSIVVTCTQFITVTTITVPFTVTFPNQNGVTEWTKCNFTLDDARDAANASIKRPIVNYGQCDIVGENITIDTFLFEDGACKKWRVKYSYKNWCTGEEINTIAGLPIVHWYAFKDVTAPVLSCSNQMFAANPNPLNPNGGCEASVALEASASDALICAEESWIKWQMFFDGWNNGTVDRLGSSFVNKSWNGIWVPQAKYIAGVLNPTWVALQNQHPNLPLADLVYVTYIKPTKASGETVKLPVGTGATAFILNAENINHKVLWKVTDGCGNVDQCESTVMVVDKKAPTPYCVSVSTALMQTSPKMVELWARDFDKGAFDNCSPQSKLYFTFEGAAPIYSRVNEEHFYKVVGGVSVNATAAEYAQGKAYKWLPSSRSAGYVWTAAGDYNVNVSVWDEAWNTDYCTVALKVIDNGPGTGSRYAIAGNVATADGQGVNNVSVTFQANMVEYPKADITGVNGTYAMLSNPEHLNYELKASKGGDYLNGVSTLDLVMIQRHILGLQALDNNYKWIAADANNDGKVTASDLTDLRKLILGVTNVLPNNASWRFPVAGTAVTTSPITFTEEINIDNLSADMNGQNFVAVKIGDVNGNVTTNINTPNVEGRSSQQVEMSVAAAAVAAGEVVEIPVTASRFASVSGFQYTMNLKGASFVGINGGAIEMNASNVGVLSGDVLTMSYANDEAVSANEGDVLFTLVVKADQATNVSEILSLTSDVTRAESYNGDLKVGGVSLSVRTAPVASIELFQNEPNPFKGQTTIMFTMPEAATATLSVHDVTGKVVAVRNISAMRGQNSEVFTKDQLGVSGVLYYTLKSGDFTATKKMIIVE